ncbi:MAG: anaerobic ribonucleoside-triphosphate reductase activating protein [Candidatus Aenigmatarchaeota archaeon]
MEIKGLQKTSLIDYPDNIAAIVFTPGCNFRCPFCQNPDLVVGFEKLPSMKEEEVLAFLKKRSAVLDGVVITGGEPTLQKDLPEFLRKVKALDLDVKLDTNGSNPGMLERLLSEKLLDYIAMDIKAPLSDYAKVAGAKVDVGMIRTSIDLIRNSGVDYEFRVTVVPKLHSEEDLLTMGNELRGAKKMTLQQFRPLITLDPEFRNEKPYTEEFLKTVAKKLEGMFGKVIIRT